MIWSENRFPLFGIMHWGRSMFRILAIAAIAASMPLAAAAAQSCPGNPDALGTERVLTVDAASMPRLGHKQFPNTLPLQRKELVLTFCLLYTSDAADEED